MNLLYVCPSSGIGGAETFIKNTFLAHNRENVSPSYLLFSEGPLSDFLRQKNAKFFILKNRPRLSKPIEWLKYHFFLRNIIKTHQIHIVQSTMAYGAIFSSLATLGLCKHIWFQHGPASGWQDTLAGILPHSGLITNSQFTTLKQKQLEKCVSLLVPKRQTLELHLGVEIKNLDPREVLSFKTSLLSRHGIFERPYIVSMICRIQDWKGVHHFLSAISILQKNYSKNKIFFFIWGEVFQHSQAYYDKLLIQSQGLNVSFEGPIDNVDLAIKSSDVIVNASTQPEPFGLSLIEAMGNGTIPVAANWGGPQEIITHNNDGLLFTPNSPESLAEQIHTLLAAPEKSQEIKKQCLKTFSERFTVQTMIAKLESFYSRL